MKSSGGAYSARSGRSFSPNNVVISSFVVVVLWGRVGLGVGRDRNLLVGHGGVGILCVGVTHRDHGVALVVEFL